MSIANKGKNKYPEIMTTDFGVGAVRYSKDGGSGSGNSGSCGIQISCILCCCVRSGGGAENKKIQPKV